MKISVLPLGQMRANCVVVCSDSGHGAVIDPGGSGSADRILTFCEQNGIKIKYILLTHAHFDHMLSLEELREKSGAPLALHSFDADSIGDPNLTYMAQFGGVTEGCAPAEIPLSDGDILELGEINIEVIHTPGHTAGSVCFRIGDSLITGDTLFHGGIGRCDLYGGDDMAMGQSLKRISALEGDFKIYPGHGSTSTLERERATNVYLKHLS